MHRVIKSLFIFSLLLYSSFVYATALQKSYFIENSYVLLSDIVKHPQKDLILYRFDTTKHTKRVKAKELVAKLKKLGYLHYETKASYIQFSKKSPIDTSPLQNMLQKSYSKIYKEIEITKIEVHPRGYLTSLPKKYQIKLQNRYYLSNNGVIYIKTEDKKKIFFNYNMSAKVSVYIAKKEIKKGEELSLINSKKSSIMLDKFHALPLQEIKKSTFEAKHTIKKETLLTSRDVVGLHLIKRGSIVNVSLNSNGLAISISAKARQSGRYGESIYVQTANGKKIKVLVTGHNRAKVSQE